MRWMTRWFDTARSDDVAQHFDAVAGMLATLDIDKTWKAATEVERRVLIDEFIEEISVLPDYLDVKVHGAPPLHVHYQEVGTQGLGFRSCRRGDPNQYRRHC